MEIIEVWFVWLCVDGKALHWVNHSFGRESANNVADGFKAAGLISGVIKRDIFVPRIPDINKMPLVTTPDRG